jgi:hypothetical protein
MLTAGSIKLAGCFYFNFEYPAYVSAYLFLTIEIFRKLLQLMQERGIVVNKKSGGK